MVIDPADLPVRLRYNLLIGSIVPRPIAVVGSVSTTGAQNLAPFSFYTGAGSEPMALVINIANPPDGTGEKDTLRNAKPVDEGGTGVFTVSVATESVIERVVAAAEPLPHGESEFSLVGLSPMAGTKVAAPWVAESPIAYECRTRAVVRLNAGVIGGGNLLIGEVVLIHLAEAFKHDRMHIDADLLRAVGRMGGIEYCTTRERASMPAGRPALGGSMQWHRSNGPQQGHEGTARSDH